MLIKTDYLAVIVPPGLKLKTIHSKISIWERREHRKISLEELGGSPYGCERDYMDNCNPLRNVTVSSRDPPWMSPLVSRNSDRLRHLNESIFHLISGNRRRLLTAPLSSCRWWKEVDSDTTTPH